MTKSLILISATMLLSFFTPSNVSASECKTPTFRTNISSFVKSNNFGQVAFSYYPKPPKVEMVESGNCYKIQNSKRGRSIYFFVNHKSEARSKFVSFLAIQIVKQFRNLRFAEDRASGVRRGIWDRKIDGKLTTLDPLPYMVPFEGISPAEFANIHSAIPFEEQKLLESFYGNYWHGKPKSSLIDSRSRLSYWAKPVPEGDNVRVENYLIRYTIVPQKESPKRDKRGVPFNSTFNDDLDVMRVRLSSPANGGVQVEFEIQ